MKELNLILIYKLELERNLKHALQRIIFWCKFFGVAPITLSFQSSKEKTPTRKENVQSTCLFVLHLMWSMLILTSISISIYYERSYDERDTASFILKCLYMGEYLFNIFNCSLIVIGCHYQSRVYKKYFNKMIDLDMKFHECDVTTDYSTLEKYLKKFWYCSALFMILATISDLMYYFSLYDFVRSAVVFILTNLLTIVTLIKYFGLLYVLKERYKSICNVLNQLIDEHKRKCIEKHATLTVFDMMKVKQNAYVHPMLATMQRINRLRKIYYDLVIFNEDINSSFGILIISITMKAFIVISTQLYAFYDIAKSPDGISDTFLAIYSGVWFIFNAGKVFLILLLNHHVCVEKSYVAHLLYKFEFNKENAKVQSSIYKFSIQIFHLKRYQATTGILILDLTLLTTLIGSLTTYFVILVQFGDYALV